MFLVLVLFISGVAAAADDCLVVTDLSFIFVKGSVDVTEIVYLNDTKSLLLNPEFDRQKSTLIYVFGFTGNFVLPDVQMLAKFYLIRNDTNFLVLDWSKFNNGNYFLNALPLALQVGKKLGETFIRMANEGFDMKKIHTIGHSLGCHVSGLAGRTAKSEMISISRITGLDCARPAFFPLNPFLTPLNQFDADFVDIIYTNSAQFGANVETGHVNFFPNGGEFQPGCPPINTSIPLDKNNFCSHSRSVLYYVESIAKQRDNTFVAIPCKSWSDFTKNRCKKIDAKKMNYMGFYADSNMPGNFYLQTNSKADFSRDNRGIRYSPK